jgi:hypothetical protein
MKTINAYELIQRQNEGKPTLVIDARQEEELYQFNFINPNEVVNLNEKVFAAKRIMPYELKNHLEKIKNWAENTEGALVVVTCTRFIKFCERIGLVVTDLEKYGVNAVGLDPHVYDWFNANFQKMLPKANI